VKDELIFKPNGAIPQGLSKAFNTQGGANRCTGYDTDTTATASGR
jgi:hypothetical protein